MKIQLDTDNKTIKIESDVLLEKLISTLDKLLPNKEWKKFTLQTNTTIHHWSNPIIIKEYPTYPHYQEWPRPWISYCSSNKRTAEYKVNNLSSQNNMQLKSGVFNLEV